MEDWFIPKPEKMPPQRATLRLGLGRADRFYRELAVPGIGGVEFVRQISWSLLGLALSEVRELRRHRPNMIANGIKALACKLTWKHLADTDGLEDYGGPMRGKLASNRSPEKMSFADLTNRRNYVQVTYRQSTVIGHVNAGTKSSAAPLRATPYWTNTPRTTSRSPPSTWTKNETAPSPTGSRLSSGTGIVLETT